MLPNLASKRKLKSLTILLNVLINEKRLAVLPDIAERYQQLMASEQEIKEVTVISAFPLDESSAGKIDGGINSIFTF